MFPATKTPERFQSVKMLFLSHSDRSETLLKGNQVMWGKGWGVGGIALELTGTVTYPGLLGCKWIKSTVGIRAGFSACFRNHLMQHNLCSDRKQQADERQRKNKKSQLLQVDSLTHNKETAHNLIIYPTNIFCKNTERLENAFGKNVFLVEQDCKQKNNRCELWENKLLKRSMVHKNT